MTEITGFIKEICGLDIIKAAFSLPKKDSAYKKAVLRKTAKDKYQIEIFTETQAFHENLQANELESKIYTLFPETFLQAEFFTDGYIYRAKLSKKGKLLTNRQKNTSGISSELSHNRKKNYIIDQNNLPPVFKELGVSTADGKIINAKYDKFKQICRFTEQINDVLSKEQNDTLNIIDFGCGKSYLTFVLYHYITEILHKKANITGLDLKRDVIEKCTALAKKYNYEGLNFMCMDIKDFKPSSPVDMVISLHACDTATDYALYFGVKTNAKYIFSVPCCQKEANSMAKAQNLSILTDYGIVKERFFALCTDSLRAKLLELHGYSTDICEFIDFENSPKNMLIRAKKRHTSADRYKNASIISQIDKLKSEFGIEITLEKLLSEN